MAITLFLCQSIKEIQFTKRIWHDVLYEYEFCTLNGKYSQLSILFNYRQEYKLGEVLQLDISKGVSLKEEVSRSFR